MLAGVMWLIFIYSSIQVCHCKESDMQVCVRILDKSADAVCAQMLSVEDAWQATCTNGTLLLEGGTASNTSLIAVDQPRYFFNIYISSIYWYFIPNICNIQCDDIVIVLFVR